MKDRLSEWWQNNAGHHVKVLLAGLAALVAFGGLFIYQHHAAASRDPAFVVAREPETRPLAPTKPVENTPAAAADTATEVVVHVTGAVKHPGVYTFAPNARANDAVQKAEPTEDADVNALNLAARLIDGDRIVVPRQGEVPEQATGAAVTPAAGAATGAAGAKVSLNRATPTELETLPGIGPSKAQAIIAYREEHGGFQSLEELKQVSGIGEKTYAQLADAIAL